MCVFDGMCAFYCQYYNTGRKFNNGRCATVDKVNLYLYMIPGEISGDFCLIYDKKKKVGLKGFRI